MCHPRMLLSGVQNWRKESVMFPQFKKINNESGVVLFIVLMTSIIIMIYSVGILTQSVNEINYAQQQIDQITTDQLSKGVFWNAYASGMTNLPGQVCQSPSGSSSTCTSSGRTYNMTVTPNTSNNSTNPIGQFTVTTSYDTFQ